MGKHGKPGSEDTTNGGGGTREKPQPQPQPSK